MFCRTTVRRRNRQAIIPATLQPATAATAAAVATAQMSQILQQVVARRVPTLDTAPANRHALQSSKHMEEQP